MSYVTSIKIAECHRPILDGVSLWHTEGPLPSVWMFYSSEDLLLMLSLPIVVTWSLGASGGFSSDGFINIVGLAGFPSLSLHIHSKILTGAGEMVKYLPCVQPHVVVGV